jgi:hypothetical protein
LIATGILISLLAAPTSSLGRFDDFLGFSATSVVAGALAMEATARRRPNWSRYWKRIILDLFEPFVLLESDGTDWGASVALWGEQGPRRNLHCHRADIVDRRRDLHTFLFFIERPILSFIGGEA